MLVGVAGVAASRMGGEFIPSLDEGDIAMHAMRIPGTSLSQSVQMQEALEKAILEFPEVKEVAAKIGTAEVATDPMPPNVADNFIMLKPRAEWPDPKRSKADLVAAIEKRVEQVPGNNYEFTQPIQMRFNELISGVRSDLGIKIFGDDLDTLLSIADKVQSVVQAVPGAADVKTEQVSGLPMLTVKPDRPALARYGISAGGAAGGRSRSRSAAARGRPAVRGRPPLRHRRAPARAVCAIDIDALSSLPIPVPVQAARRASNGRGDRADRPRSRPALRAAVGRGRDRDRARSQPDQPRERQAAHRRLGQRARPRPRLVRAARCSASVAEQVKLPAGYWIGWGGQFEQLVAASQRLAIVVPVALLLIFVLLCMSLGSVGDALLVFSGVPLALTGGVAALVLRDIPLSISAGVGFIAL